MLLSLLGGLHCAGMCGGFAVLTLTSARKWHFSRHFLLYSIGKTSSYALAGAVFGGLGSVFHRFPAGSRLLAGFAGLALIAIGLEMAGVPVFRGTNKTTKEGWLNRAFSGVVSSLSPRNSYAMGILNGLLPCGLLYAAFAGAASTGNVLTGALFMAVFGLGTIPVLFFTGHLLSALSQRIRGHAVRFTGWMLLIYGLVMIFKSLLVSAPMSH